MNRRSFLRRIAATTAGIAAGAFTADKILAPQSTAAYYPPSTPLSPPSYLSTRQWQRTDVELVDVYLENRGLLFYNNEMDSFFGKTFSNGGEK